MLPVTGTTREVRDMKLVGALMKFFGKFPGETLTEFSNEYKALTEKDKDELTVMLREQGFDIEDRV